MNTLQVIHFAPDQRQRNQEIEKVYFKILEELAELSQNCESESLRTRVEIDHRKNPSATTEIYELLTPCIYLDFNVGETGKYSISYAINDNASRYLGHFHYTQMIRILYKLTSSNNTQVNIEDCLSVYPYYSEVYDDARHSIRDQEYDFYQLITEQHKGQ